MHSAGRGRPRNRGRGAVRENPQSDGSESAVPRKGEARGAEGYGRGRAMLGRAAPWTVDSQVPRDEPELSTTQESAVSGKGEAGGAEGYGRGRAMLGRAAPWTVDSQVPRDEPELSTTQESAVSGKGEAGGAEGYGRGRPVLGRAAPWTVDSQVPMAEPQPSTSQESAVPVKGEVAGAKGYGRGRPVEANVARRQVPVQGPMDEPQPSTSQESAVPGKGEVAGAKGYGRGRPVEANVARRQVPVQGPMDEPQPSTSQESAVPGKGEVAGAKGYGRGRPVEAVVAPRQVPVQGPMDEPQPSTSQESAVPGKGEVAGAKGYGRGRPVEANVASRQVPVQGPMDEPQPSTSQESAVPGKGEVAGAKGYGRGRPVEAVVAPRQVPVQGPMDEPQPSTSLGPGTIVPWKEGAGAAGGGGTAPSRAMRGNMRGLEEVVVTRKPDARSKQGTLGTKVMLKANYFRLERKEQHVIFQHHVHIDPPLVDLRQRHALFKTQAPLLGPFIFDGTQLYLYNKLRSDEIEMQVKDPRSDALYKMCIKRVGTVNMTSEKALQLLNLMHKQAMASLKLVKINRHFFDPADKICVPQYGLELLPGYMTSIRQHEHSILLGVQVTHRVLHSETVYQMYQKMLAMKSGTACHESFRKSLIGAAVMTMYNQKTYVVSDVQFDTTPLASFTKSNGETVTFMQYFKEAYNIRINDPHQPMLVSVSNRRKKRAGTPDELMLVPELCRLTGVSEEMRKDHRLMCAISNHTRLSGDQRIKRLERLNARLVEDSDSNQVLAYWRTELDRRLMDVPARVLPQENLFFARQDPPVPAGPFADWNEAFRGNRMFRTEQLLNWCVICPEADLANLKEFISCLTLMARGIGFTIAEPTIARASITGSAYIDMLRSLLNRDPQLIMCVVPNERADRYRAIKKLCCIDRAVPTQVVRSRTIAPRGPTMQPARYIATKIAIQMSCKLGGIPWMVKNPLSSVMVVGYDVCHATAMANRSYGALVATMYGERADPEPRFFSCVEPHAGGLELSSFISAGIVKALRAYQNYFGSDQLPRRIFFYRDGVGDGQLGHVFRHEVGAIRERLQYGAPDRLKLTFFVVSKRIGTRLFDGGKNPPPGTVVDDNITLPERTDFFLVSQSVHHGTVSPTSYNIIHDESGLNVDQLQLYTSKQTHLYYNWPGAISVPAVCQYAHKLAGLVGQYLNQMPNERLDQRLYFL